MPTYSSGRVQLQMAAKSTVSKMNIQIAEMIPANRNWMQLSFTPSQKAVKWSMTRICTAKHTAQTRISRSPGARENSPLMHSRYRATTDSTTAIQVDRLTFRLKNRPNRGTSTTYSAVRKPALPLSVPATMPACWKLEATASAVPQHRPPSHSCLLAAFFWMGEREGLSLARPSLMRMTTSSASTAMKYRVALKVNAPMESAHISCATKAVPQMKAARMGNTTCRT